MSERPGLLQDAPRTLAWCSQCDEPLVFTFIVPRHEWYCLTCGGAWAFLSNPTVKTTEKRWERFQAAKKRFIQAADGLIVSHSKHEGCERCFGLKADGSYHREHATPEELAASEEALLLLRALQTKRKVA